MVGVVILTFVLLYSCQREEGGALCTQVLLGTKFKPSERISNWGLLRVLEESLVMYFIRLVCLCVSFWICLRVVFLDFLLAYVILCTVKAV